MISVITTLYNYARFVSYNIQSVLNQSYSDWELIIVDDASKDKPEKVVVPYTEKYDNIFFYQLNKNMGYSYAKNYAIEKSRGDYITTIDADDMLTQDSLKCRVEKLEKEPSADWVHGRAWVFKEDTSKAKADKTLYQRWKDAVAKNKTEVMYKAIHAQTVMARRRFYEKYGLYDESIRFSADREMWLRVINQGSIPIFVDQFVCYYRRHNKQMHLSSFKKKNLKSVQKHINNISIIRKNGINRNNTRMLGDGNNR